MGKKILALLIIIGGSAVSLCAMGPSTSSSSSSSSSSRKGKERVIETQKRISHDRIKQNFFGNLAQLPDELSVHIINDALTGDGFNPANIIHWRMCAFSDPKKILKKRIKYGEYVDYIIFSNVASIAKINESQVVVGYRNSRIMIYDLVQDAKITSFKPYNGSLIKIQRLNGTRLLAWYKDGKVMVFTSEGKLINEFEVNTQFDRLSKLNDSTVLFWKISRGRARSGVSLGVKAEPFEWWECMQGVKIGNDRKCIQEHLRNRRDYNLLANPEQFSEFKINSNDGIITIKRLESVEKIIEKYIRKNTRKVKEDTLAEEIQQSKEKIQELKKEKKRLK